jgi:hypothetical protein
MSLLTPNFDLVENKIDDISFGLLRTNPKLSTNIKLVVDSQGSLFMDAIPANNTLSTSNYKKFPINANGAYSHDVARFFGQLSSDITFDVARKSSDISVYGDYSLQFEDQYHYGASFNSTKMYDEQYKFFAPIWLEKNIPSYFVIYRVKETDYKKSYDSSNAGQNSRVLELLNSATLIKTFDLTKDSNLGKYLRSHVNDDNFPKASIFQNYASDQGTIYNGIDVIKGGFVSKKEFINPDLFKDKIEILNNTLITDGFKRNQVASANLINLEFLFDDKSADNYKIYRYFGLYVDAIEEGQFGVHDIVNNDNAELIKIEKDTIITSYDLSGGLTHQDMFINVEDLKLPTLNWIKSNDNQFFHIRNNSIFDNTSELPVSLNKFKASIFTEKVKEGSITLEEFTVNIKDVIDFTISVAPHNADKLFLAPLSELKAHSYKLHEFEFVADISLPKGKFNGNLYSAVGNLQDIAGALAGAIDHSDIPYTAKSIGERVIIEDYAYGNTRKLTAFGVLTNNISDFVQFNIAIHNNVGLDNSLVPAGVNTDFTEWSIWTSTGGGNKNEVLIVKKTELKNGIDLVGKYLQSNTSKEFVKIKQILEEPYDNSVYRIVLEKPLNIPNSKTVNIFKDYLVQYGKFSAYSLKDFDFDFYNTSNSELNELAFENFISGIPYYAKYAEACGSRFYEISEEYYPTLFPVLESEIVNKRASITNLNEDADLVIKDLKINSEYDRLAENELKETALYSRLVPHINKFAIKDSFNARMKPYTLNVNEAFGSDNMSPVLQDGRGRDPLEYNMEHFHINGIPSVFRAFPENTHTLNGYIDYENQGNLTAANLKSTTENYFDKFFVWDGMYSDISAIKAIVVDNTPGYDNTLIYFTNPIPSSLISGNTITKLDGTVVTLPNTPILTNGLILQFVGNLSSIPSGNPTLNVNDLFVRESKEFVKHKTRKLYTRFDGGSTHDFATTTFRGIKYTYKSRKETVRLNPTDFNFDTSVNGYKFASVINLQNNANKNTVEIEVIKNDAFKFVCIYINLKLQENDVKELSRKVLYELVHARLNQNYIDVKINGALDLRNANWSTGTVYINGILDNDGNSPEFMKQLTITQNGSYSYLLFDWLNPVSGQYDKKALKVLGVHGDSSISVAGYPVEWDSTYGPGLQWTGVTSISSFQQINIDYTYLDGGYNGLKELIENIKAPNFKKLFEKYSPEVTYTTIKSDGTHAINEFSLHLDDGTPVIKPSVLKYAVDPDKPLSYKITSGEVGKIVVTRDDAYYVQLRRINEYYNPIVNDIVDFTDIYSEYKSVDTVVSLRNKKIYDKFNRTGIAFNTYAPFLGTNYGIIKNMFYHKVNPNAPDSTLKLSSSTDKAPLYPKIGEVAIDKKDINVFDSKYSTTYYTKYNANNSRESVYGTLNPIEHKSFLASTIMKVEDSYQIAKYNSISVKSLEELNNTRINQIANTSIVWFETEDKLYADFYIKQAVLQELLDQGIKPIFDKYVDAAHSYGDLTTTEDDLKQYVDWNVVPRFIINQIDVYTKETKQQSSEFLNIDNPGQIDLTVFTKQSNFQIEPFVTDRLGFRLIYNKRYGYNYMCYVVTKIIA